MGDQRTGRPRSRSPRAVGTSGADPATSTKSEKPQLDLLFDEPAPVPPAKGQAIEPPAEHPATQEESQAQDFDLAGESIGKGGLGQKYRDNIAAIQVLKTLSDEGRKATPDERKTIARYVGWGALKGVFDPDNKQWSREHAELRALLTDKEWESARASMLNAHYTSPTVVNAMYQALEQMGFRSGRVLEPSVGVGNFFGLMPGEMRKASKLHGVEIDPLTASIAAALYPSAKIASRGYEDYDIPAEYFDLAVGNPPFGNTPLVDMKRSPYSGFTIHNYFLAKTIDKLRPGGMMAMVVSRYFMDTQNSAVRKWISDRADLVTAVRLPNTAFLENAGTEVVTDIVIFQKRAEDVKSSNTRWVETDAIALEDAKTGEAVPFQINRYFLDNPGFVLGIQTTTETMYRANDYTVEADSEHTLEERLNDWAAGQLEGQYTPIERGPELETADVIVPEGVKEGSFYVGADGGIMIRGADKMGQHTAIPWEAPNLKAADRVKGMIALREGLRQQMRLELSPESTSSAIEAGRATLNRNYDSFVKAFGYVHDAANLRLFRDDTESSLILALEFDYDRGVSESIASRDGLEPKKPSARKADILHQRVLFPPQDNIKVDSARDALLASLNYRGGIDLPYMESIYPARSADEIVDELGEFVFDDPLDGLVLADEYLSGDVKTKLENARAAAEDNKVYQRNIAALEKVIPADKRPSEINATLGAAYIPPEIFSRFAEHVTGDRPAMNYIAATGQWIVHWRGTSEEALNVGKFGTSACPATDIFKATLDGKGVVVTDTVRDANGHPHTFVREKETAAAREKQQIMKDEWKRWLWSDPERATTVSRIFNDKLNRIVPRKYDGTHLTLPGLSPVQALNPHQKDAVWRGLQSRQVLLDHAVGAGKTAVIVAIMMEMRRLGIARKPFIAVPNHLTLQWQSEFTKFFPASRVLAATPDDFTKENRERFFAKIVTGDWDAVVVGHSSLKKIGLPRAVEEKVLKEQVSDLSDAIERMKRDRGDRHIVRDMEKIKANIEARIKKKAQDVGERDKALTFDELGADAFAVDELHEFKNLYYNTTADRVPGMGNPSGSDKAFDLFVKSQWMWETYGDKSVLIGATGTPISNSMVEMFNLQRYMQYPALKEQGLHVFDAWARQFANAQSVYEVAPSGTGYRQSSRLEFTGISALMPLYQSFTDTVTLDDLKRQAIERGKTFPVPKIEGGQAQNIVAERSPEVAAFMGVPQLEIEFGQPTFGYNPARGETARIERGQDEYTKKEKWKAIVTDSRGGPNGRLLASADTEDEARLAIVQAALTPSIVVDPKSILGQFERLRELTWKTKGKVNALSLTGQANKAGLDFRLLKPDAPDFPGSKINLAVGKMMEIYRKWDADKGTQLVFCDLSVPLSCRASMASKDSRLYVREDGTGGAVIHKRGTLHTVKGFEELPFYLVKEKDIVSIYDAGSGVFLTGAQTKDEAKQEAEKHLRDEVLREAWIEKREAAGIIDQGEIDDYNTARGYDENAEGAAIGVTDVAAVSGAQGFSVYDDIKAKLIARGVPEREIAFIHDFNSPAAKDKLFKAVNQGDVRFLFGSTPKMGAGTNVQKRLVGLHHIDAPWRPSDLEQREGRIVRQGNLLYERDPEGFEVSILRYATSQTYDTRRWQLLEHKARMIAQLRNYDGSINSIEDIGSEASNAADMKAAASGDPLILDETRLRNEVRRLESLQNAHVDEKSTLEFRARENEYLATKTLPARLASLLEMQEAAKMHPLQEGVFPGLEIGGKRWTERDHAIEAIKMKIAEAFALGDESSMRYRGVEFTLNGESKDCVDLESPLDSLHQFPRADLKEMPSAAGFITRFNNYIEKIPQRIETMRQEIETAASTAKALRQEAVKPFDKADELDATREAYRRVQRQLVAKGPDVPREQKPILEAALQSQRKLLIEQGYGEALREFLGMKEQPLTTEQKNAEFHRHGMRTLEQNCQTLATDPRYGQHTDAELTKAAFYRGVVEKKQTFEGKPVDFRDIDNALANLVYLKRLPEIDVQTVPIERRPEHNQGKARDQGQGMEI